MNTDELKLAYQVRLILNRGLLSLSPSTLGRLALARKLAMSSKKREATHHAWSAGTMSEKMGIFFNAPFSWLQGIGFAFPLIVLLVGLVGIYQFEQQERLYETAEMDALVLADELPLSAYADRGFNAYLSNRGS